MVRTEGRSQEIVEQYLRQHGIRRRELLRSPHFLSIPMVIASTPLVVMVPVPIAELFGRIVDLQILQHPIRSPFREKENEFQRSS